MATSTPNSIPLGGSSGQRARSPQLLDPLSRPAPNKRRTFIPWRESFGDAAALDDDRRTGWNARDMHLANQKKINYVSSYNELDFTTPFKTAFNCRPNSRRPKQHLRCFAVYAIYANFFSVLIPWLPQLPTRFLWVGAPANERMGFGRGLL